MKKTKVGGFRDVAVRGMTCRSCEVKIERSLSSLPGVAAVGADATRGRVRIRFDGGSAPDEAEIVERLMSIGYAIEGGETGSSRKERPSFWTIAGSFAAVIVVGRLLSAFGLLNLHAGIGEATGFVAIFVLGLVAASSSCIAVSGGLLLSSSAKFRERYGSGTIGERMRPVLLFVGGRIASYTLLGGVIGALGRAFEPSPIVSGAITVAAAVYMLVMGLDMLGIAPGWLMRFMPRMPKRFSKRMMDAEGRDHPLVPLVLGAGTFFLPCGFTQSLQLYALTTGSFVAGAVVLSAFALGTAPALLALGFASGSTEGVAGKILFRFAGALVVILGVWNISNGLSVAGYPISIPRPTSAIGAMQKDAISLLQDDGSQVINVEVTWAGYSPDRFILKAGVPAVINVYGEAAQGCGGIFTIPRLGVRRSLTPTKPTRIAFTPTELGTYPFACSMGMLRGSFDVIN